MKNYRVWPIFTLAFIRQFYVSIFDRALFNYLLFIIGINESTLGFITSASSLSYIIGPLLGQFLTSKFLGIRKALILNCILTPVLTGAQIFYPEFLLVWRIMFGLSMGLYWPNSFLIMSNWQKISSVEKSKKNFAIFNFSWNFGYIGGLIIGFLWVFSLNDYTAMGFSWIASFGLIPISFFIQKDETLEFEDENIKYKTEYPLPSLDVKEDLIVNSKTPMVIFPVVFSWICILFFSSSKSIFLFGYPVILNSIDFPSYYTYLVLGIVQISQLAGLTWINYMAVYKRKIASLLGVFLITIISLLIMITDNIWYISVLTASVGLFSGLIQGVGMKITIEYGTANNASIYSTMNEIFIGIGFGVIPIITGFIAEIEIFAIYWFLMIIGVLSFSSLIILSRNIKRKRFEKD